MMGRSITARCWLLSLVLVAGQGWAGEAWVGDYRIRDAQGERALVLVRDDNRVEYRVAGEPIRVWRQTSDGLELTELYPAERRRIVYAPGDLRTMELRPDWAQLTGLVDPALRTQLAASSGDATAFAQPLTRYRGNDAKGARVELDWLAEAGLPARYCTGQRCGRRRGEEALSLLNLKSVPAEEAFTPLEGLLEIDHADLGDMEQDAFVRKLSHAPPPAQ